VDPRRLSLALDVLRACFVLAALGYVAAGAGSVINLAFSSAAVVAVRFVALPQPYDLAFIGSMTLTGWGDALGLYDRFAHYDSVVHFLVPSAIAPIVYILLARGDVLPDLRERGERHHLVGIFVVTLALGLAIGAVWEIYEWSSDHAFGSSLVRGESDTVGDLVADGCGALVGGALLVAWRVYGWGTERRTATAR
jgi:uncharacterized membrane protein YjdF